MSLQSAPVFEPPYSRELQEAVLACAFHGREALEDLLESVSEPLLYGEDAQVLLRAIRALHTAGGVVDVAGVRERVHAIQPPRRGGVEMLLLRVVDAVRTVSPAALPEHVERLRQYACARVLLDVGRQAMDAAADIEGVQAKASALAQRMLDATVGKTERVLKPLWQVCTEVLADLRKRQENAEVAQQGQVFSGLAEVDRNFGPMQGLVLLAGRPGMGKTAFGLEVAVNAARSGHPVLIETLEMRSWEIAGRALAAGSMVNTTVFSDASKQPEAADWRRLMQHTADLEILDIVVQEAATSMQSLRRDIQRKAARCGKMPFVVLDRAERLQELLMVDRHANRNVQCALVAANLAALAHDLGTTILAMVQLSRDCARTNRRPNLTDLRDSGGWEQEADRVMFIHREDYHDRGCGSKGVAEILVEKNRNGPTGAAQVAWMDVYAKFGNLDRCHEYDA